ncbi:uncharacterized protein C16orf74 homolog isoform X9 [Fukomys damarensis]|uniref:uncharacterized protein C16orf74 homolog isoform X9 n=1 Tax=Fukomys damarensis TaxID=885580 RepID=UPI0014559F38|nr:uncharacterized protein C16orf74 homolog isoform X9 [Fukomys damarensis]
MHGHTSTGTHTGCHHPARVLCTRYLRALDQETPPTPDTQPPVPPSCGLPVGTTNPTQMASPLRVSCLDCCCPGCFSPAPWASVARSGANMGLKLSCLKERQRQVESEGEGPGRRRRAYLGCWPPRHLGPILTWTGGLQDVRQHQRQPR